MKSKTVLSSILPNSHCFNDPLIKCIVSECCTKEKFQSEMITANISTFIILTFISFFLIFKILTRNLTIDNNKTTFKIKEGTFNNKLITCANLLIKMYIFNHIMIKLIEIVYIQNLYSNHYNSLHQIILLSLHIFSIRLFSIGSHFLEFTKKYLCIIFIYLYIYLTQIYSYIQNDNILAKSYLINSFVSLIVIILAGFLYINYNIMFYLKLNRDDDINDLSYQRKMIDEYSTTKLNEDYRELYNETNRVFSLYKVYDIIKKIRENRFQVWSNGLNIIFIIAIIFFSFNIYINSRVFKISFNDINNGLEFSSMSELYNFDYIGVKKILDEAYGQRIKENNFPKSVMLIVLDGVNLDHLQNNDEYNEFVNFITKKEKNGRVYDLFAPSYSSEPVQNLIGLLTGTKSEFNGVRGDEHFLPHINEIDSLFDRMNYRNIENKIIGKN